MKDLRSFLDLVENSGEKYFYKVEKPLSPELEVSAVQHKLARRDRYPVLYCNKVEGSQIPLVSNLFGSYDLLGLALDFTPGELEFNKALIVQRFIERLRNPVPEYRLPVSQAPVKEIKMAGSEVDLRKLPITKHAPQDSGRYVVIGVLLTREPDSGQINAGVYRHELRAPNRLAAMINPAHHGSYIARKYLEKSEKMECVLFVGHHPAAILGSLFALSPMGTNDYEVMSSLLGEPMGITDGETVSIPVPSHAEIVIEGVIDPQNRIEDGPFAEYTGYYGNVAKAFEIEVNAVTMRRDAIYHDLDTTHQEHNLACVLGMEAKLLESIYRIVPTVQAVHVPVSGCCQYHAYVQIKKRVPGEGRLAGMAALASDINLKHIIVVDEDIDVYDEKQVLWAVATRVQADQSVFTIPAVTGAHLDPSSYNEAHSRTGPLTTKMVIDATRPVDKEFAKRAVPSRELIERIDWL